MKNLEVHNSNAAGLDIGSEKIHASISGETPRVFATFTDGLFELRDWLLESGVTTVALEATGVYWMSIYEVLEHAKIEVVVVNGKHVRNLPGRKTDMADCQWIATMHAHGLLKGGFVPTADIRRLQDYMRLRDDHLRMGASHIQHMQKALERMNLKPHDVLSQLSGVSGLALIRAILAGERDPQKLLEVVDPQVRRKKTKELLAALKGNWKDEHLFALGQALELYDVYHSKIAACDERIAQLLKVMADKVPPPEPPANPPAPGTEAEGVQPQESQEQAAATSKRAYSLQPAAKPKKKLSQHNAPKITQLHDMLLKLCGGADATQLPGLTDYTLLMLVGETGTDLSKWPTAKQFTAWLGLAPASHQSGKRRGRVSRQRNRAGRIFCTAARSLARSVDKALGGFYRRIRSRRGGLIANQALARKLAELYWRVMTKGLDYVEKGLKAYEEQLQRQKQRTLEKLALSQGFILTPVHG